MEGLFCLLAVITEANAIQSTMLQFEAETVFTLTSESGPEANLGLAGSVKN